MSDLAAIGIVAAIFVALLYAAIQGEPYQEDAQPATGRGTEQQKPAEQTLFSIFGYRVLVPDKYEFECKNPRDTAEADLCEQLRMAKAGERQVHWVKWQYVAGVAGIALLALTFWEAKRTADAALEAAESARQSTAESMRAADAAEVQADAAQAMLTKVQRPYVFIFGVQDILPRENENLDGYVPYTVANYGQTPAVIEFFGARLCKTRDTPEAPAQEPEEHPVMVSPILRANEIRELRAEASFQLDSGNRIINLSNTGPEHTAIPPLDDGDSLFFWIKIFYRGPFTNGHETSACWRYDVSRGVFIQYGGREYNYEC